MVVPTVPSLACSSVGYPTRARYSMVHTSAPTSAQLGKRRGCVSSNANIPATRPHGTMWGLLFVHMGIYSFSQHAGLRIANKGPNKQRYKRPTHMNACVCHAVSVTRAFGLWCVCLPSYRTIRVSSMRACVRSLWLRVRVLCVVCRVWMHACVAVLRVWACVVGVRVRVLCACACACVCVARYVRVSSYVPMRACVRCVRVRHLFGEFLQTKQNTYVRLCNTDVLFAICALCENTHIIQFFYCVIRLDVVY